MHHPAGGRRSRSGRRIGLGLVMATLASSGCASLNAKLRCVSNSPPDDIEVRFLGVAGFFIRRGTDAILTAPMFTNPNWYSVGLGSIAPDKRALRDGLGRVGLARDDLDQVRAILVGHAHYDHLLDVPALCEDTPNAKVYGNATVQHILAAQTPWGPCCVENVDADAVGYQDRDVARKWRWLIPGRVRMLVLKSEHSAQFELDPLRFNFWEGSLDRDLEALPTHADRWVQGPPYAYLIDFLDSSGKTDFRLYYADSSTCSPCGYVPEALAASGDTRPADLVILNAGGSETMSDFPFGLLRNTCGRRVLLGHWENFFARFSHPDRLELLPGVDELVVKLRADGFSEACLPVPGTSFFYEPGAASGECRFPAWNRERACGCRVVGTGRCEP